MSITEKQRKARNMLGSSDLAAVCGLDPWRNAADVYASLVYELDELAANDAMTAGNLLEVAILDYAATKIGSLKRNQTRRVKGFPIRCNIDALAVEQTGEPVEGKSSGITNPYFKANDEWGEAGSDEVPDRVKIQAHGHMLALTDDVGGLKGYPKQCHVPALLGGRGFAMFVVPFERDAAEDILIIAKSFWTDHVIPKVPPADVTPSMQTLKRIVREPESVKDLSVADAEDTDAWMGLLAHAKNVRLAQEKNESLWKELIINQLGNAEAGRLPDGRLVHYKEIQRKGYSVEPSSYRKLVIKKAPKQLEAM